MPFLTSRWPAVTGFILALNLAALVSGGPLQDESGEAEKGAPSQRRRIDREKLRQFRERRTADSGLKRVTWKVDDQTREALVYVPPKMNEQSKPPLIFAFHGHGGRAEYSVRKMPFHELWPEAVCVYPQGLPTPVPVIDVDGKRPGWQKYVGDQDDRDLKFFDAMRASLKTEHQIDDRKVYVAGHSNGGYFTYVLCAARGDTLAAVAPIAALIDQRDFKNQKPIPTLHVAGKEDPIVRFASQERTMEKLRALNGCEDKGKPAGDFCMEYASKAATPVVTYIHSGGHEIPEGAPQRIIEFFREHSRPSP